MIADISHYTNEMSRSIDNKLYCAKYLTGCDLIVDFGCADGTLLYAVGETCEDAFLIGYDKNPDMILRASLSMPLNTLLTDCWDEVVERVKSAKRPGIILSSVMHELYDQNQQNDIWWKLSDFSVICIRDMCVKDSLALEPCDYTSVWRISDLYPKQFADFVRQWGDIHTEHDLLHFLLKYRYTANWEHEVRENYLGLTWDELITRMDTLRHTRTQLPFTVARMRHFQLPFIADRINRDTGINIPHRTHIECVLVQP